MSTPENSTPPSGASGAESPVPPPASGSSPPAQPPPMAAPPVIPSKPPQPKPQGPKFSQVILLAACLGIVVLGGAGVLGWYLAQKSLSLEAPKLKARPSQSRTAVARARTQPPPKSGGLKTNDLAESGPLPAKGTGRWVACPVGPTPRIMHSALWTGRQLLVWGGGAQDRFLNDGAAYDPSTSEWQEMSASGLTPRWGHAAVWTGQEMIVWGGRSSFAPQANKNDGARYDPATDTWKAIASAGAPTARSQPAVAWTGEEVIVWGGIGDGDVAFIDGARYNPATDRWAPMSTNGAPVGRTLCAASWTGTELIVWGGLSGCENMRIVAGGARYDPKLDRWQAIAEADAPSPRCMFAAVWTGKELIVSGGRSGLESMATPAREVHRYDPVQNRWTNLTNVPALAQRQSHAAAWTGSEIILWGGQGARGAFLRNGVRYNPATGEWSPMTVAGAPSARISHSAVWTGDSLLVFGGFTGGNMAFNSLHAYFPEAVHPAESVVEETVPEPAPGVYRPWESFGSKTNPSGVWSFGWMGQLGGEFTPLKTFVVQRGREAMGIISWQLGRQESPSVFCNTNRHRVENIPPRAVWFDPGQDQCPENYCVIRFTSPEDGAYRIQCPTRGFYGDRAPGGDTDFHVAHNGREVFGQFLPRAGISRFGTNLNLKTGDTVDFAIGRGQDQSERGSALFIDASVAKMP